ncbi:MAG: hypothetical protein ABFC57_08925 [Veillonellales bacterium]
MDRLHHFIITACCLALLGFCGHPVFAAPVAISTPLEIADIGTLLLPLPVEATEAKGVEGTAAIAAQYDITANINDTRHYARLIIYKDTKDMGLAADIFTQASANTKSLQLISGAVKEMVGKSITENGAQLLQWYPLKPAAVGKTNAINLTSLLIVTEKLPLPMFANVYVFTQDRHLTGLALLCPDSDRTYWEPLFRDMMATVKN